MDRIKWACAVWYAFGNRNLTRGERDVLLNLKGYCVTGVGWPKHTTLASNIGCSTKTVARALAAGRALGLVDWHSGGRWLENGRWKRRSNRYWLKMPEVTRELGFRPPLRRHSDKGLVARVKKERAKSVAEQLVAIGYIPRRREGSPEFRRALE